MIKEQPNKSNIPNKILLLKKFGRERGLSDQRLSRIDLLTVSEKIDVCTNYSSFERLILKNR